MGRWLVLFCLIAFLFAMEAIAQTMNWTPLAVANDPLVRLPGTQPNQVTLEAPGRCTNCHAGYNTQVEPGFNWQGSMMAQAARDFIFFSCMAVAAQDSIHALGRPNAVDICERCHFPKGWLEGRSDPPNASLMTAADYDGVQCDFCHTQFNPFFESTNQGTREGSDWLNYWDETNASKTKSQAAAAATYTEDQLQAQGIRLFNGGLFFSGKVPFSPSYTENGAGQFYMATGAQKRASFADHNAKHQVFYSRFHKSKYFCNSCHDVSNPALANIGYNGTPPGDGTTVLTTESQPAYSYFHVERTFSEFMLSDYAQQGGAPGIGPFAPSVFDTSYANNYVAKCQDCHMRDVVGVGCNKAGTPIRPTESIEHPKSGQPLHDMTGGNIFVTYVLASAAAGSPNYDATNNSLLFQGSSVLTLDPAQGLGLNAAALLAGVDRAKQQLQMAASIQNAAFDPVTRTLTFRVQNQTGHKLISGFPEGRRMFLNIRAYNGTSLAYEINPYDSAVGTLKGLPSSYSLNSPALGTNEAYVDELVYEMHPKSDLTGEDETFHFALATGRYKDNRIPPKGFRIADAAARLSEPVWHGQSDPDYFTSAEYAGGYDEVSVVIPVSSDAVQISLYYQTTSREYIEFLRDEINGTRQTLPSSAYIAQTDPFFSKLRAWGNTMWQLWDHNKNVPGAAPFLMTQAAINIDNTCEPPVPVLQQAVAGDDNVTLTWTDEHSADTAVVGYNVYYDQGGKAQLVAQLGLATSYVDSDLVAGQQHCYKVTSRYADCESAYSNILCATAAPLFTIGEAKMLPDGSWVRVNDAVVTLGSELGLGYLFVESPLRVAGIKLLTTQAINLWQRVGFTGAVSRVDGEWQIGSVSLFANSSGDPLAPLGLRAAAICNDPTQTLAYAGVNTTGMLVHTWGRVKSVDTNALTFYLDDGFGCQDGIGSTTGLRVQAPDGASLPSVDDYVSVTGVSRVEKHTLTQAAYVNGQLYDAGTVIYVPSVWLRSAADVVTY